MLKRIVKGALKLTPAKSTQPKQESVMIEHLRSLQCNLDLSNTFDIAVFVVTCVAFWCYCRQSFTLSALLICSQHGRLGELFIDSRFDHASQVSQSTPISCGIAANSLDFMNFHVPHMKMQEKGEDICHRLYVSVQPYYHI